MPRFYHVISLVPRYFSALWELNYLWAATEETNLVSIFSSGIHELLGWLNSLNLPRKNHITVVNNYLAETTSIVQSVDA